MRHWAGWPRAIEDSVTSRKFYVNFGAVQLAAQTLDHLRPATQFRPDQHEMVSIPADRFPNGGPRQRGCEADSVRSFEWQTAIWGTNATHGDIVTTWSAASSRTQ